MPSAKPKRYHASIGKSVTFFMVGDAERLAVFLHCKMTRLAHSCPGRMRRHVRSWRKPTPHSKAYPLVNRLR
jgi:hypothetical protein